MADCQIIQEVCKRAGERKLFPAFDLTNAFSRIWLPSKPYGAGVLIRPATTRRKTGFEYESDGGVAGPSEPKRWPTTVGDTLVDGSITWTCREMSTASLIYRISSVTYDTPAGITLHEQDFIDDAAAQQVPMEVSGGTVGSTYDVVAQVQATTVDDSAPLYELVLRVTVE